MKTYFQLIAELKPFDSDAFDAAQKAKYGSSMAKAAADALAAAQKRKAGTPLRNAQRDTGGNHSHHSVRIRTFESFSFVYLTRFQPHPIRLYHTLRAMILS